MSNSDCAACTGHLILPFCVANVSDACGACLPFAVCHSSGSRGAVYTVLVAGSLHAQLMQPRAKHRSSVLCLSVRWRCESSCKHAYTAEEKKESRWESSLASLAPSPRQQQGKKSLVSLLHKQKPSIFSCESAAGFRYFCSICQITLAAPRLPTQRPSLFAFAACGFLHRGASQPVDFSPQLIAPSRRARGRNRVE